MSAWCQLVKDYCQKKNIFELVPADAPNTELFYNKEINSMDLVYCFAPDDLLFTGRFHYTGRATPDLVNAVITALESHGV